MWEEGLDQFKLQNKARRIQNGFGTFVRSLMWFLDVSGTVEKFGVIRILLCNINSSYDIEPHTKQKIDKMIDEIQRMLEFEQQKDQF
jgi:hypothetical protein